MSEATDNTPEIENVLADRRRPGRPEAVSPELIALLRASELRKAIAEARLVDDEFAEDESAPGETDQLSTMRGIVWGVGLSIPAWLGIAAVGNWLLQ